LDMILSQCHLSPTLTNCVNVIPLCVLWLWAIIELVYSYGDKRSEYKIFPLGKWPL